MIPASADQRVLGYLGRSLSLELTERVQYSTLLRLLKAWGLDPAAERFQQHVMLENDHPDQIISRMVAVGVLPNSSQLRPPKLGRNVYEILLITREFQTEFVNFYSEAGQYCAQHADYDNYAFFEQLLQTKLQQQKVVNAWVQEFVQVTTRQAAKPQVPARSRVTF